MSTNKEIPFRTIEQQLQTVGSRFGLAQLIMKRTNQLIKGAPVRPGLGEAYTPRRQGEIPNHRFPKVALEELRRGQLKWQGGHVSEPSVEPVEEIVFNGDI